MMLQNREEAAAAAAADQYDDDDDAGRQNEERKHRHDVATQTTTTPSSSYLAIPQRVLERDGLLDSIPACVREAFMRALVHRARKAYLMDHHAPDDNTNCLAGGGLPVVRLADGSLVEAFPEERYIHAAWTETVLTGPRRYGPLIMAYFEGYVPYRYASERLRVLRCADLLARRMLLATPNERLLGCMRGGVQTYEERHRPMLLRAIDEVVAFLDRRNKNITNRKKSDNGCAAAAAASSSSDADGVRNIMMMNRADNNHNHTMQKKKKKTTTDVVGGGGGGDHPHAAADHHHDHHGSYGDDDDGLLALLAAAMVDQKKGGGDALLSSSSSSSFAAAAERGEQENIDSSSSKRSDANRIVAAIAL